MPVLFRRSSIYFSPVILKPLDYLKRSERGFPDGSTVKKPHVKQKIQGDCRIRSGVRKIPGGRGRKWQPSPVTFPGESHEQRSLPDAESDTTEPNNIRYL